MPCIILTHRGLEPSKREFYPESSYEAFSDQLQRGFGIEFDPNFTRNGIVVWHDQTLKRISEGKDERAFSEASIEELKQIKYGKEKIGRIATFNEVLGLIEKSPANLHAVHLKGINQTKEKIDFLVDEILNYPEAIKKLLIFDVKPETAEYIKLNIPQIKLAPSIAHEFDIKRYNGVVKETLFSVDDAIKYKRIYDWVWLDEWDTKDENGEKKFYTKEVFEILKNEGYKIALVTPELHATSPGLYGGESHKDARNKKTLISRIKEIIELGPDAICTDYPEEARKIFEMKD